jgi:hypothetical protein
MTAKSNLSKNNSIYILALQRRHSAYQVYRRLLYYIFMNNLTLEILPVVI